MHVVTELDPISGALFARNAYSPEFADRVVFVDSSETIANGDRRPHRVPRPQRHAGEPRGPAPRAALRPRRRGTRPLRGHAGPGRARGRTGKGRSSSSSAPPAAKTRRGNSCSGSAARPAPSEPWRACGTTGAGRSARSMSKRPTRPSTSWPTAGSSIRRSPAACGRARASTSPAARSASAISCRTRWPWCMPSPACCASICSAPPPTSSARGTCSTGGIRPRAAACARTSPTTTSGCPTRPAATSHATGDTGVLDERVPFLQRAAAAAGGRGVLRPAAGFRRRRHALRALRPRDRPRPALRRHGLPLMGCGDWNDGMNLVGQHGKGESVWLAFFLYDVLTQFAELARRRGDAAIADKLHARGRPAARQHRRARLGRRVVSPRLFRRRHAARLGRQPGVPDRLAVAKLVGPVRRRHARTIA